MANALEGLGLRCDPLWPSEALLGLGPAVHGVQYAGKVLLPEGLDGLYGEIWVSMRLCRQFAQEIEEFFKRLFKSAGLPDKGAEIVE